MSSRRRSRPDLTRCDAGERRGAGRMPDTDEAPKVELAHENRRVVDETRPLIPAVGLRAQPVTTLIVREDALREAATAKLVDHGSPYRAQEPGGVGEQQARIVASPIRDVKAHVVDVDVERMHVGLRGAALLAPAAGAVQPQPRG